MHVKVLARIITVLRCFDYLNWPRRTTKAGAGRELPCSLPESARSAGRSKPPAPAGGETDESIEGFRDLVARYGESTEAALQEQVTRALINLGITLGHPPFGLP
jgi:hypothetical protein